MLYNVYIIYMYLSICLSTLAFTTILYYKMLCGKFSKVSPYNKKFTLKNAWLDILLRYLQADFNNYLNQGVYIFFSSPFLMISTSLNLESLFSGHGTVWTSLSNLVFGKSSLPVTSAYGHSLLLSRHLMILGTIETPLKKPSSPELKLLPRRQEYI